MCLLRGPVRILQGQARSLCGCDLFWEGGGKKNGRMSRREFYDFNVWNYAKFHEVEQIDRETGKVKISETTQKPFTNWVQCGGRKCDACVSGRPTKLGHMQHYPMGFGHFSTLEDYSEIIGKSCTTCCGRDTVSSMAWLCGGCQDAVIDMSTTTLDDKEILKITREPAVCPSCKHKGYLQEVIECSNCTPQGKLPSRASIFDVDINVKRVSGPDGSNQNTLMITGYSAPYPIDPKLEAKPLDLDKTYAPTPMETQCEKFKIPMPAAVQRTPVTTAPAARQYSQQQAPAADTQQQAAPPPQQQQYQPPPQQQQEQPASRSPFGSGNMFGK